MNHLTVDEIIDFVSFEKIDGSVLELSKRVNSHISHCDECLEKVKAFQLIYDELKHSGNTNEVYNRINNLFFDNLLTLGKTADFFIDTDNDQTDPLN